MNTMVVLERGYVISMPATCAQRFRMVYLGDTEKSCIRDHDSLVFYAEREVGQERRLMRMVLDGRLKRSE